VAALAAIVPDGIVERVMSTHGVVTRVHDPQWCDALVALAKQLPGG
jgi:hypothetical protein